MESRERGVKRNIDGNILISFGEAKKLKWLPPLKSETETLEEKEIPNIVIGNNTDDGFFFNEAEILPTINNESLGNTDQINHLEYVKYNMVAKIEMAENNLQCVPNRSNFQTIESFKNSSNCENTFFDFDSVSLHENIHPSVKTQNDYQLHQLSDNKISLQGSVANEMHDNYENSPINMYSAFMMSFGLEHTNDINVKNDATIAIQNLDNESRSKTDINCKVMSQSEELDKIIIELQPSIKKEITKQNEEVMNNSEEAKVLSETKIKKEGKSTNIRKTAKNTGLKSQKKSVKKDNTMHTEAKNHYDDKMTKNVKEWEIPLEMQDVTPFTGNYKLADKRNKLRLAHQQKTGELKFYELMFKNKRQTADDKRKLCSKTYSKAASLCELSMSILEAIEKNDENEIINTIEKFFSIIVTYMSQQHVPHFLLIIKIIRGSNLYSNKVRAAAQRCYSGCRAMYGVPIGETFESVFIDEVTKLPAEEMRDNDEVIYQLKDSLDETFEMEDDDS